MDRIYSWIKRYRKELQLGGLSLLAGLVGVGLVLACYPSGVLPRSQRVTLSEKEKQGQDYLAATETSLAVEDLLSLELLGEEGWKKGEELSLDQFVNRFGRAQTFISEETPFASVITLGYGRSEYQLPYQMEFQQQGKDYFLRSIQVFAPSSKQYPLKSKLKKSDFASFQTSDKKASKVEEVFAKVGLPASISIRKLGKQQLAVTYRLEDGLMALTFVRDPQGHYVLTKKG